MNKNLKGLGMQAQEILELEEKAQALKENITKQLVGMIGMKFEIKRSDYDFKPNLFPDYYNPEDMITFKIIQFMDGKFEKGKFQVLEGVGYDYCNSIQLASVLAKSTIKFE